MGRLLVAEDDADIRFIVVRVLERAGHQVDAVADGVHGLAALRRARPDLLITDLDMPRLGGEEMCRRAAAEGILTDVPILIISGAMQPGDTRPIEIGAADVLLKPFVGDELLASVERLLHTDRPTEA